MSNRFKLILFVRFIGYFVFLTGLISFVFMLGPLAQAEFNYRVDRILGIKRTVADIVVPSGQQPQVSSQPVSSNQPSQGTASFADVNASENTITPVSTEYGIVIEKINANAKIVPQVNPANEAEYTRALGAGVAEALGSTPPGQQGNLYLFSHSTDAPWNIVRFNAIFYLLRELEPGDKVIIFYQNKRYDYIVFDKKIVGPNDVSYLTTQYQSPVLTLQTCDPPGTLINRLIVRAKLINS